MKKIWFLKYRVSYNNLLTRENIIEIKNNLIKFIWLNNYLKLRSYIIKY